MKIIKIDSCYVCPFYRQVLYDADYCTYWKNVKMPDRTRKLKKTNEMRPPKWCRLDEMNG